MPSEPISGAQNTDTFRFEGTVNYQLIAEANLTKPRQLLYTHTHTLINATYTHTTNFKCSLGGKSTIQQAG